MIQPEKAALTLQVAELQAANADLQERLAQYRIIFESMDEGFALCEMIFDQACQPVDFRYLRVNPAFAKLTGFIADQVIGKTVKQLIPTIEPHWIEAYARVVATGRSEWFDYPVEQLGKHYSVYVWRSGPGRFAVIFNDITEYKKLENKINGLYQKEREERHQLQEEAKLKIFFIDVLAHELRTPLTALLSSSEMLAKEERIDAGLKTRLAANIYSSAQSLAAQLDDLLDTARFSRGAVKLNLEPIRIRPFLEEVAARFEPALQQNSHHLDLKISPRLAPLRLDRPRIEQVIVNLLSNAAKYSPKGSPISMTAKKKDRGLLIEVSDCGKGISPEDQKLLFQNYRRVGKNPNIPGTGLGLVVTKQIVEAHGGQIWVTSTPGQGSTFSVFIPPSPTDPSQIP